jgi:flavin-dependent dehydrogenase
MATLSKCVYCYQFGSDDCFKVGHTKNSPEKRKRGLSTGSPKKLTLYKKIPSESPTKLEKYIHYLLDPKRAENGEYFNVTKQELDDAIASATATMDELQLLGREADKFKRKKPNDEIVEATDEMRAIYGELRKLIREKYIMERRIEILASKVQLAISDNLGMKGIASWKWRDQWKMDTTRFKREHEALYKEYQVNLGHRVFLLERVDLIGDAPED